MEKQVISGIAEHKKPEELIGTNIILVANLKPAKLRGELSEGMILAASTADGKDLYIVTSEGEPGTEVR